MAKGERPIVLYPAYFDRRRTRDGGRRVARRVAVDAPTVEEIAAAARSLGLEPEVDPGRAYPTTPWRREGRVLVKSEFFKTSVVKRIAEKIREQRAGT